MKKDYLPPAGYSFSSTNYTGMEMRLHAQYAKEGLVANDDDEVVAVYQLYYQKEGARPLAIPCSSLHKLQLHAIGIIMKNEKLEPRFKLAIEKYMTQGSTNMGEMFRRAIETFRTAQLGNNIPLGFDLWWEEEPQVLL